MRWATDIVQCVHHPGKPALELAGLVFRETNDAMTNIERLFALLDARGKEGEDADASGARPLVVSSGTIGFDNVNFSYEPGRQILWNVSFRVEPGQTVAVVGGSGSGKSTLARLLFSSVSAGRGKHLHRRPGLAAGNPAEPARSDRHRSAGHDPVNETLAYNIAYGREGASRAEVVEAARGAQLEQFIDRLPDSYDTRVGERGVRLSGESASVSRSRVPCSNGRRSWCSTKPRRRSTRVPSAQFRRS